MANQLVTCSKLQQPRSYKYMKVASCGERSSNASLSRRDDSSYKGKLVHKMLGAESKEANGAGKSKKSFDGSMKRQSGRHHSPAFHLMRFWFIRSSVNYLLKKVKVLQNPSGCKVPKHSSSEIESSCVNAYFSIPVVPA